MNILFHAHSGLRYLVLLAAVVAIAVLVYALATGKPVRAARAATAAFIGVLDLQVLLGIILLIFWPFYGQLIGHIATMVLAAVVAHGTSVWAKKTADARRMQLIRLLGIIATLVLIVGGILAIQRPIL